MSSKRKVDRGVLERVAAYLVRKRMEEGWKSVHAWEDEKDPDKKDVRKRSYVGTPQQVSQSEMAKRFRISQGSLSQYERGTRLPEGDNLHAIAAYLGVEFYDVCEVPRSIPDDPSLQEVIEAWGWMPKDTRKKYANLIRDEAEAWKERSSPKGLTKKEVVIAK